MLRMRLIIAIMAHLFCSSLLFAGESTLRLPMRSSTEKERGETLSGRDNKFLICYEWHDCPAVRVSLEILSNMPLSGNIFKNMMRFR